jgi:hypothetical protein
MTVTVRGVYSTGELVPAFDGLEMRRRQAGVEPGRERLSGDMICEVECLPSHETPI